MIYYAEMLLLFVSNVGAEFYCRKTETYIESTGKSAVFFADGRFFPDINFYNTTGVTKEMFAGSVIELDPVIFEINFHGQIDLEKRMHIESAGRFPDEMNITIELRNIGIFDNGTYALLIDRYFEYSWCWAILVVHITSRHKGQLLPEGSSAIFDGHPTASHVTALGLNATCTWLLNGLYENQTTLFHIQGDVMEIPYVSRYMDGWNVTYSCFENSGDIIEFNQTLRLLYIEAPKNGQFIDEGSTVFFQGQPPKHTMENNSFKFVWLFGGNSITHTSHTQFLEFEDKLLIPIVSRTMDGQNISYRVIENNDVAIETNCTLRVSYGPNLPLQLIPYRRIYKKTIGDNFPEVSCYADCNPPCNISWGIHSNNHLLKLDQATKATVGEYTCTAIRHGTDVVINETIYVFVKDDAAPTFTLTVIMLITAQALSCALICCLVVLILHRRKLSILNRCKLFRSIELICKSCTNKEEQTTPAASRSRSQEIVMSTLNNGAYEDLHSETRARQHENYNCVEIGEVYVNTQVESH